MHKTHCFTQDNIKISIQRSIPVRKKPTEKQLPSTPDNAKHKSRQVKKKNGNASGKDISGKS
jgi:hypothetical protein